jgi:hypothetical protein
LKGKLRSWQAKSQQILVLNSHHQQGSVLALKILDIYTTVQPDQVCLTLAFFCDPKLTDTQMPHATFVPFP